MSLMRREKVTTWPTEQAWSTEHVDRVFRDMFRDFFGTGAVVGRLFDGTHGFLNVEEFVEDGACVIRAEMPGIDPDKDVEITVTDGVLHIRAHREERTEDDRPDGYRSEFRYGMFERAIGLPEGASDKDITATYKDGILVIRVPMPAAAKTPSTKVPVSHA